MNVDNVKSQMRKGMLEYCILLLLHRESAYSSDIIQKLARGCWSIAFCCCCTGSLPILPTLSRS